MSQCTYSVPLVDTAFFISDERSALTKMAPLCELQAWHEVDIRTNYTNHQSCTTFVEFTAQEQRDILKEFAGRVASSVMEALAMVM